MLPWHKLRTGWLDHPKVRLFRRKLDVTPREARGILVGLWGFAAQYADDGVISRHDPEVIAEACDVPGCSNEFLVALTECGLVDDADGVLTIHDWAQEHERFFKERARKAEARRKKAEAEDTPVRAPSAPEAQTSEPARKDSEDARKDSEDARSKMKMKMKMKMKSKKKKEEALLGFGSGKLAREDLKNRWNRYALDKDYPQVKTCSSKSRKGRADKALKEGILADWDNVERGISRWSKPDGWSPTLDWLLQPDKWLAVSELGAAPDYKPQLAEQDRPREWGIPEPLTPEEKAEADEFRKNMKGFRKTFGGRT